jgi:hypothetical protein
MSITWCRIPFATRMDTFHDPSTDQCRLFETMRLKRDQQEGLENIRPVIPIIQNVVSRSRGTAFKRLICIGRCYRARWPPSPFQQTLDMHGLQNLYVQLHLHADTSTPESQSYG